MGWYITHTANTRNTCIACYPLLQYLRNKQYRIKTWHNLNEDLFIHKANIIIIMFTEHESSCRYVHCCMQWTKTLIKTFSTNFLTFRVLPGSGSSHRRIPSCPGKDGDLCRSRPGNRTGVFWTRSPQTVVVFQI